MRNRTFNIILIIIILLCGISFYHYYEKSNRLESDLMVSGQNNESLKDSVRTSFDKVGNLEYSKSILISSNEELENLNLELYQELDKVKGEAYELNILNGKIKGDTIFITNNTLNVENDSIYNIEWDYEKEFSEGNYRYLKGKTRFTFTNKNNYFGFRPLNTLILEDQIHLKITQGLREKDGKLEVFAKSDYPGFVIDEINSVIIDPEKNPILNKYKKKNRFHLSIYTGYGVTYDFKSDRALDGVQIGGGISYTFF